ncbi:Uncharacterized membrane protein [Saccharopolyspora antimicrobica]|uniref:Membrane protein n=1 Tax=Saccharopolyspora antimicrobica TaxID=455193 RepID=A0A1I5G9T0_9PSEU|nr:DUF2127 domain-containing protein [Saccharopolyspora antimicrobica]RKT83853.1 putative membrane protein [Saccharopolyspora antimicrobica]SFO32805.1 Uncharacterized membrane protein [Saccharopolyspora antimicrobica]
MRGQNTLTDKLFLAAVLIKGLDGAVQLIGGIVLAFLPPDTITRLAHAIVTRDLVGPPEGALAGHFEEAVRHFADGDRTFVIAYLLLHGAIKLVLVIALLRKILPMYPVAVAALGLFVVFEVLRAARTGSIVLPLLAAIDVVIIILVVKEYLELRHRRT